jgi:hypothetical protein
MTYNDSIDALHLSTRVVNILFHLGIIRVCDIAPRMSEIERAKGMGPTSVRHLKSSLAVYNARSR